jgi:hypothetical protein
VEEHGHKPDPEPLGHRLSKPVCVLSVAVMHFFDEQENPHAIVARSREAMTSGSYVVLSHISGDGTDEADYVISVMRQRMGPTRPRRGPTPSSCASSAASNHSTLAWSRSTCGDRKIPTRTGRNGVLADLAPGSLGDTGKSALRRCLARTA